MKTNFQNKNFALSLAFIVRLKGTRSWPVEVLVTYSPPEPVSEFTAARGECMKCLPQDENLRINHFRDSLKAFLVSWPSESSHASRES